MKSVLGFKPGAAFLENVCVAHDRRGLAFPGLGLPIGRPQTEHHLLFTYSLAFPRGCGVPVLSSPQQGDRRLEPCGRCGLCLSAAGRQGRSDFQNANSAFRGRGRPAGAPGRRRSGVLSFPELVANSARTAQEVAALPLWRAALTVARAPSAPSLADRVPATARKQEARPRPGHLLAWGAKRNPEGEARTEPRVEALPSAVISDDPALVPLRPATSTSTSTSLSRLQVPKDNRGGTCLYRRVSPKPRVEIELTLLGVRAACRCVGEESSSAAQTTQAHGAHGAMRGHAGRADPNTPLPFNTTADKQLTSV